MNKSATPTKSIVSFVNNTGEQITFTKSEQVVFATFRNYLMTPHRMLCFFGPSLEQNQAALKHLTEMEMLVKESFKGAYSLTSSGYAAMNACSS
jgi:hypothetical protein